MVVDSITYGALIFVLKLTNILRLKGLKCTGNQKVTDSCVIKSCLAKEKPEKFILETEENRCIILKQPVPLTTSSGFPRSVPKYSLTQEGGG